MATSATIHFLDDGESVAIVYKFGDGYPKNLKKDFTQFFSEVIQLRDQRLDDPSYLAAKFVVWQAAKHPHTNNTLDFGGVGILTQDTSDIKYRYLVYCDSFKNDLPWIEWQSVSFDDQGNCTIIDQRDLF